MDNQYSYVDKYGLEFEISSLYRMAKRLESHDKLSLIGQELRLAARKLEKISSEIFGSPN